jgi:hypothetical protein
LAFYFASILLGCSSNSESLYSADAPNPPSPLIQRIEFGPKNQISRAAEGSDNWPVTWGDDDRLYTAYGDGFGFEPHVKHKLSLGLAAIVGEPPLFTGINLRTPSGEKTGDGPKGIKASGLLMADGILFMLVRNTDNNGNGARLVWSDDRGLQWQDGYAFHPEFGCPTFLNSGPNHIDAKDTYVYVYSQKGPNAYTTYDHVVLARAKKQELKDPRAWQFFTGVNVPNGASWSTDPEALAPVLTFEKHCFRLDAVYIESINRYLLLMAHNYNSGWSIFDAPTPWGPWTTAFHTTRWDVPGVHGYRLPIKWFNHDNFSFYLLFSGLSAQGYDAFCLRKAQLILR